MKFEVSYNRPSKTYCFVALINSFILILLGYFANNMALFTSEIVEQYYLTHKIFNRQNVDCGDAVFFNVAYDKELVPAIENFDTVGNYVITDRGRLNDFLILLHNSNKYKFIVLDIAFDDNDISPNDSALFSTIKNCERLVFVDHDSISLSKFGIKDKSALAFYYTTMWNTNFARYEYMNNGRPSVPLFMYEKLYPGKEMTRHGFTPFYLYFIDKKLCQNSVFLKFDDKVFSTQTENRIDGTNQNLSPYENVGEFLATKSIYGESGLIENIGDITNGKIVVIGDLIADKQDTYLGEVPGSVILMRAYQTLVEGGNIVSFGNQLYWFIIFFVVSLFITNDKPIFSLDNKNNPRIQKPFIRLSKFILSIFSFSSVLVIFSIIEYMTTNHVYSLTLPIIYFTLLKSYSQFRKY